MRLPDSYSPPPRLPGIDLDLSRNEGLAPDPSILGDPLSFVSLVDRYPDSAQLRDRLARLRGVQPDRVLVTAGGDDALLRCCSALIDRDTRVVTTTPTFEMVARYTALQGADPVEIPWKDSPFPIAHVTSSATVGSVCVVVSPNNPTGETIGDRDLELISEAYEWVILDGAYTEFADIDLTRVALETPNVLMIRTMSKAWGLAGLRVGYLLGESDAVSRISAHGNPYPVSSPSLAIALRRIELGEVTDFVSEVRRERKLLTALLRDMGLEPIESEANFVFAETSAAERIRSALADSGIAIRTFPNRPELERALRITVPGEPASFSRLVESLNRVLRSETESAT